MLLLDKTGTITLGNRQAVGVLIPVGQVSPERSLADAAQLSSLADETPEGRSIVVLAKEKYGLRGPGAPGDHEATFIPFTAQTRMSGVDMDGAGQIRKGASDAVMRWVKEQGGAIPAEDLQTTVEDNCQGRAGRRWSWRAMAQVLGVIHLKDIVKGGMKERFAQLRRDGHSRP